MILSPTLTSTTNSAANRSLDIYAKVEKTTRPDTANAASLVDALNVDKATLSGVGQLQNMLANFQGVVHSLAGQGLDLFATATSPRVLEANTSGASVTGKYEIQVKQLAQSQVLQSQALAAPDVAIGSFGTSKLSIEFGTVSQSGFSSNAVKSIAIPAGENTLQGVSDAINHANVGVTARLIAKPEGVALEIVSPSGASNSMRIGVSGDAAMQTLLSFDPFGARMLTEVKGAQDAALTVNGEAVNSFSNTVKFGVPGTTLHLKSTGTTALVIEQGTAQIEQNVGKFVDAYNTLNGQLNLLDRGELSNDGSASHIRTQLAQALSASDKFSDIGVRCRAMVFAA
jgi:flagellar hook-associated protein 2